ncbi:Serine O-succinyltransferase [Tilletia horrida]|nr:Serine O-succinyltransferase [Tilletia horrida]
MATALRRLPLAVGSSSRGDALAPLQLQLQLRLLLQDQSRGRGHAVHCRPLSTTSTARSEQKRKAGPPTSSTVSFPCVDANEARAERLRAQAPALTTSDAVASQQNQDAGPSSSSAQQPAVAEPAYANIVSGYETFTHPEPFLLDYGGLLPTGFTIAYETWGELNDARDNVILLHTGLSASSHAAATDANPQPGWWQAFIGPGKAIDTNRFFVICTNVLGGCYGSTGPSSPYPISADEGGSSANRIAAATPQSASVGQQDPTERWATRFPILSLFDMIRAQFLLLDHLGISTLYASVGSSMGGMQSIAAAHLFPERVERVVSISGCARSAPGSIALRYAQRSVLMSDPNWNRGAYYGPDRIPPHTGMKLARQIATITYRSGPEWEQRFGRQRRRPASESKPSPSPSPGASTTSTEPRPDLELDPALCPDFLIETYIDHQGEAFCLKYDANSLIYISKAMDLFDMSDHSLADLRRRRRKNALEIWGPEHPEAQEEEEEEVEEGHAGDVEAKTTALQSASGTTTRKRPRPHISTLSSYAAHAYVPALARGLANLRAKPVLVIGVQSDILFPVEQQRELAECLRMNGNERVTYYEIDAPHGHDSFLIDVQNVGLALKGFLMSS